MAYLAEPLLQIVEPPRLVRHGLVRGIDPLHLPRRELFERLALVRGTLDRGRGFFGAEVVARVYEPVE